MRRSQIKLIQLLTLPSITKPTALSLCYEVQAIAKELGRVKLDDEWLQAEIARLKSKSIVPLQQVITLHDWLDGKRKARQSCRVVGESRTGKTVACDAYRYRQKPQQEVGKTPIVPVVYIQPPQKCGAKDLFQEIIEYLKFKATEGTVSEIAEYQN